MNSLGVMGAGRGGVEWQHVSQPGTANISPAITVQVSQADPDQGWGQAVQGGWEVPAVGVLHRDLPVSVHELHCCHPTTATYTNNN